MAGGRHGWQGGRHVWQGACVAGVCVAGACMAGGCGGGMCVRRRPLQRTARIPLGCILVLGYFLLVVRSFPLSLPFSFIVHRLLPV